MLQVLIAALAVLALAKAITVLIDALGLAGRAVVRGVFALCVAGFAVAAGALTSAAVENVLGAWTVLGLSGGRWAGIATTCLLLALAAFRYARDEVDAATIAFDWEPPVIQPSQVDLRVPLATRRTGPWWSPAARRAKKESREELARAEAWDQFALRADWAAARIAAARGACEGFLRGLPAEPGLLESELAVALRRRVPEIISETVEAYCTATPSEARALADEGVQLLELLAAEAERRRPVVARGAVSRLATKRAYVEEVVRRGQPG